MEDSRHLGMRTEASTYSAMTLVVYFILYPVGSRSYDFLSSIYLRIGLVNPVRSVAFSPGGKLLAAAGHSKVIALYDVSSGEQVANLLGHGAWVLSLDWSDSGEFLLSG